MIGNYLFVPCNIWTDSNVIFSCENPDNNYSDKIFMLLYYDNNLISVCQQILTFFSTCIVTFRIISWDKISFRWLGAVGFGL